MYPHAHLAIITELKNMVWESRSAICKSIPWTKMDSLCDMSIFIHVAS